MAKRLFDEAYCDGMGMMICHCGGDLCVCGMDGEDCYGCEKCEGRDDEYFDDDPTPQQSQQSGGGER